MGGGEKKIIFVYDRGVGGKKIDCIIVLRA